MDSWNQSGLSHHRVQLISWGVHLRPVSQLLLSSALCRGHICSVPHLHLSCHLLLPNHAH